MKKLIIVSGKKEEVQSRINELYERKIEVFFKNDKEKVYKEYDVLDIIYKTIKNKILAFITIRVES